MATEGEAQTGMRGHRANKAALAGFFLIGLAVSAGAIAWAPSFELGSRPVAESTGQPSQQTLSSDALPSGQVQITGLQVLSAPGSPEEPLRLAMTYGSGRVGAILQASWTVDGRPFRSLRVILASADGEHAITSVPPQKGWPPGEHRIVMSSGGVAMREASFRIG
ncbi:MAG: hypothetical protein ACRDZO_00515 [Egibacteraceae bacterium]